MKKLLIISSKLDTHADYVIKKINELGYAEWIVRLNTEDLLTNAIITFNSNDMNVELKDSGYSFNSKDVGCVWYRRPESPLIPEHYAVGSRKYIKGQMQVVLDGIYHCLSEAFWINPRNTAKFSSNKPKQLHVAKKIGFKVPNTIITNSFQVAKDFIDTVSEVCIKPLDISNFSVGEQVYSKRLRF